MEPLPWIGKVVNNPWKEPYLTRRSTLRFLKQQIAQIEGYRRRFDYLEHSGRGQYRQSRNIGILQPRSSKQILWNELVEPLIPEEEVEPLTPEEVREEGSLTVTHLLQRHLTDYHWLVNSLRLAWHAGRIYLNSIASLQQVPDPENVAKKLSFPKKTIRDTFSRSDLYKVSSRDDFKRYLSFPGKYRWKPWQ